MEMIKEKMSALEFSILEQNLLDRREELVTIALHLAATFGKSSACYRAMDRAVEAVSVARSDIDARRYQERTR
jgi:hypothetical protein